MRAFSPGAKVVVAVAVGLLCQALAGSLHSRPASASDNFSLRVSLERSRLRRELRQLRQELENVEDRYQKLRPTAAVNGRAGAFLAQERAELRNRRRELQSQIESVKARFRTLRGEVMRRYGDLPGWWSDTPYP